MALKKKIRMQNGLELEYHKIALVTIEPGQKITILKHSYLNEESRQYEKDYAAGKIKGDPVFPYMNSEYIHLDYSENIEGMNGDAMKCAYGLLRKHRSEFVDAENI